MKRSEFLASCGAALAIPGIRVTRPNVIRGFHAQGKTFEHITAILEDCSFYNCAFMNCHFTWYGASSCIVNSRFLNDDEGPAVTILSRNQGERTSIPISGNFFYHDERLCPLNKLTNQT